jgi:hypothetical protein
MNALRVVHLSLFVALSACTVGEVGTSTPDAGGGGGGGGSDAGGGSGSGGGGGQSFTAMIAPLVTECLTCHSAGQTPPNLTSFSALDVKYKTKPGATNILVTKGTHQNTPYLTPAETATVAAWIEGL